MTIKEICEKYGYSQTALAKLFGIPLRTVQDWHSGRRTPPDYITNMMTEILDKEKKGSVEMNMEVKEMDNMHRAYQRGLLRHLEKLNSALNSEDYTEAKKLLAELIEDTQKDIAE